MARIDWSRNVSRLNEVLAAIATGHETLAEIGRRLDLSPAIVSGVKRQYLTAYRATAPLTTPLPSSGFARPSNWLKEEDAAIRLLWPHRDRHAELYAVLAGRTRRAVVGRASSLGVKLTRISRRSSVRLRRIDTSWSEKEDATLIRMHTNGAMPSEIAVALKSRSVSAVRQAIYRLGLVRSGTAINSIRSNVARRRSGGDGVKASEVDVPTMPLDEAREVLPLNGVWLVYFIAKQKVSSGDRLRIAAARTLVAAGVAKTRSGRTDAGALRYMIRATCETEIGHG